jgi:hypothetical protein
MCRGQGKRQEFAHDVIPQKRGCCRNPKRNNQSPKQDWLNYVVNPIARNRIKQTLKSNLKQANMGGKSAKAHKNRKIEFDKA